MLATPVIGFVVGAGGYLAAQVFADTYSGKMPGPKSFGYFIGTITAATALGLAFMGRKQGYLAESSYLKGLVDSQEKPPKQDLSKVDLTGYFYRGRPIKRAESGRCANCNAAAKITAYDLPVGPRNFCSERCYCMYSGLPIMEPGYYGMEAEQKLSKTECCCGATMDNPCECMLAPEPMQCSAKEPKCPCYAAKSAETFEAEYDNCPTCNSPRKEHTEYKKCGDCNIFVCTPDGCGLIAQDSPWNNSWDWLCDSCYDKDIKKGKKSKRHRYGYDAETFETTFLGNIPDWELHAMYDQGKITLGQLRLGIGWKKLHEDRKRIRTMSGRPVSETLRKMKRDKKITPEEARERKEIRAESCGCSTTCKCRN